MAGQTWLSPDHPIEAALKTRQNYANMEGKSNASLSAAISATERTAHSQRFIQPHPATIFRTASVIRPTDMRATHKHHRDRAGAARDLLDKLQQGLQHLAIENFYRPTVRRPASLTYR
jgi:hypothetical protein